MTREELRRSLYDQTGEWFSDQELHDYMGYEDFETKRNDYTYSNQRQLFTVANTKEDEDDQLNTDDLINEVHDMFSNIVQKAKSSYSAHKNDPNFKTQLDELSYHGKIFLCKMFLYHTLQRGAEKGYNWKNL
jgi:hypothetical protein